MNRPPTPESVASDDLARTLAWLARTDAQAAPDFAETLLGHLQQVALARLAPRQRQKLLDLFYLRSESLLATLRQTLAGTRPPLPRPARQRIRLAQDLLETLAEAYLALDDSSDAPLYRACRCLARHIEISHLASAPATPGLWRRLHGLYATASQRGCADLRTDDGPSLHDCYLGTLLTAISQPASFNADDLALAIDYIATVAPRIMLSATAPAAAGIFWIDPASDAPAFALTRRTPGADSQPCYFATDEIARLAHRQAAASGDQRPPAALRKVLQRLEKLWGNPVKRKFPRRRRTYRIRLFSGLPHLWDLFNTQAADAGASEWMVTNESPEGYALMHIHGDTLGLGIGDIVAVQLTEDEAPDTNNQHIAIVRWALSENPEHFEIGLQLLATRIEAATAAIAGGVDKALFLPQMPPLRHADTLIVPAGRELAPAQEVIVVTEPGNVLVREFRIGEVIEQTGRIALVNLCRDATA